MGQSGAWPIFRSGTFGPRITPENMNWAGTHEALEQPNRAEPSRPISRFLPVFFLFSGFPDSSLLRDLRALRGKISPWIKVSAGGPPTLTS